jgi:hypothetical protein
VEDTGQGVCDQLERLMPPGGRRARLIVSGAVAVLATLGMWAVHMPFWLILGVIAAVASAGATPQARTPFHEPAVKVDG